VSNVHNLEAHRNRAGANIQSAAEEIEQAIIDLARVVGVVAIEAESVELYTPVIGHLVKARRALRDAFGKE
jgi:hypothetical protein